MAERKATNKYYPPDWEPDHGSLNHYVKRVKRGGKSSIITSEKIPDLKANKQQTMNTRTSRIRFEMPMAVWCEGCRVLIPKGTRFNADKRQTDWYHTTPVYSFTLKCSSCPNMFVISSDPVNTCYRVSEGGHAKLEPDFNVDVDTHENGEAIEPDKTSAFGQLELRVKREERVAKDKNKLKDLLEVKTSLWSDDHLASQAARRVFRLEKRRLAKQPQDPVGDALKRLGRK